MYILKILFPISIERKKQYSEIEMDHALIYLYVSRSAEITGSLFVVIKPQCVSTPCFSVRLVVIV